MEPTALKTLLEAEQIAEWNTYRPAYKSTLVDLRGCDFSTKNLEEADLRGCDLRKASFVDADLRRARFNRADLREARFGEARMHYVDLRDADARHAKFRSCDLKHANLSWANLEEADCRDAKMHYAILRNTWLERTMLAAAEFRTTTFANVDLSRAVELEQATHAGPSILDRSALRESSNLLPESFLRGCGLTEWEIKSAARYMKQPTLFVSYSSADGNFARRLYGELVRAGIAGWVDKNELDPGDRIEDEVRRAIENSTYFLLIASVSSIGSKWVRFEAEHAVLRKKPIRVVDPDGTLPISSPDWKLDTVEEINGVVGCAIERDVPDEAFRLGVSKLVGSL